MSWIQERLKLESGLLDYPLFNRAWTPVTKSAIGPGFALQKIMQHFDEPVVQAIRRAG